MLELQKGSVRNLSAALRQISFNDFRFGALSICRWCMVKPGAEVCVLFGRTLHIPQKSSRSGSTAAPKRYFDTDNATMGGIFRLNLSYQPASTVTVCSDQPVFEYYNHDVAQKASDRKDRCHLCMQVPFEGFLGCASPGV